MRRALQIISQQPHPGIIGYHGCRVRMGRINGLVLDKHPNGLKEHLKDGVGEIERKHSWPRWSRLSGISTPWGSLTLVR
jgi:hypothetical protein